MIMIMIITIIIIIIIISYCRKICMIDLDETFKNQGKIGGETHIIQVDEAKIGKMKYQRGRLVVGVWIVGMIDMTTHELRIEICRENKRDTTELRRIIQKHIASDTIVVTDEWKGYYFLSCHDNSNDNW